MNLCIIVPCFNEAKRIPLADFSKFLLNFPKVVIHFVNDGSTDQTLNELLLFKKQHPKQVQIVDCKKNLGKGNAIQKAMQLCIADKAYDTFAFLDADLSTVPEECVLLAQKIDQEVQFVFGSRIKKIDNEIDRKWSRFLIGRIIATVISKILNLAVYDTQCGCKIFTAQSATIAFQDPFISPWLFDVEIFFRLKKHFGVVRFKSLSLEIPLKKWKDQGESKIKWTYGFVLWFELYKIYKTYR